MSETERTLLIADLSGYTALTETHGALHASEVVLRFGRMALASLEPGISIIDQIGDQVLCAGADTQAVLRCALRLFDAAAREPGFLAVQAGLHRGAVIEREGRLFGTPLNLTARLAAYAAPDQILCTETVAAGAAAVEGLRFERLGRVALKNIEEPVPICEVVAPGRDTVQTAIDPVCQMRVETASAVSQLVNDGRVFHFCSSDCAQRFATRAERGA